MNSRSSILARYAIVLPSTLVALFVIDISLEALGDRFEWLRLDPDVWGTYGDWAGAVLPFVAIATTVDLWLRDVKGAEQRRAIDSLIGVRLTHRPPGAAWLDNPSAATLKVTSLFASTSPHLSSITVLPGQEVLLSESSITRVEFKAMGMRWSAQPDQAPVFIAE